MGLFKILFKAFYNKNVSRVNINDQYFYLHECEPMESEWRIIPASFAGIIHSFQQQTRSKRGSPQFTPLQRAAGISARELHGCMGVKNPFLRNKYQNKGLTAVYFPTSGSGSKVQSRKGLLASRVQGGCGRWTQMLSQARWELGIQTCMTRVFRRGPEADVLVGWRQYLCEYSAGCQMLF